MGRIIKDIEKLEPKYVPEELPHREEELGKLRELYGGVLDSKTPRHSFITGRCGAGKTALAKRFFAQLVEDGKKKGVQVDLTFVNCKNESTVSSIMQRIARDVLAEPGNKADLGTMTRALKACVLKRNSIVCVMMDEAAVPFQRDKMKGDQLVYSLTRINEVVPGPSICLSVCLVSNDDVLALMQESTKSAFGRGNVVRLERYSRTALQDILVQRVQLAFHSGAASKECLEMIADIASGTGDARHALELLLLSGLAAQTQGCDEILPEHVRAAEADVRPWVTETMLAQLGRHERLMLLGAARILRKGAYASLKDVYEAYRRECEGKEVEPRGALQARKYLERLETEGLIETKREGEGRTSKIMVTISAVPTEMLVKKLEERHIRAINEHV